MAKQGEGAGVVDNRRHNPAGVYLRHILLTLLVIAPAATVQAYVYYGAFELRFFVMPLLVGLLIGSLLGRSAILKRRLHDQREQFRAIADLAQEFTYYRRLDGRYEYVSPACTIMTGYSEEEFYQTPNLMDLLIHPEDRGQWSHHVRSVNSGEKPVSMQFRLIARDGRTVWFNHVCAPVLDEKGDQIGVRSTNLDITRHKEDEARIERMAFYDPLTELPNRRSLVHHIRTEIKLARNAGLRFAILFLDLNRFKNINDSLGHSFGDRLLKRIAERLRHRCHRDCLVSRFGGDEFIILLRDIHDKAHAAKLAKSLLLAIEQPLELDGVDLHVSGSIGIAFYPDDGEDEDALIRNADVAMYKTKKDTNGGVRVYCTDFSDEAANFVSAESLIQRGIRMNEFIPHYQPKVDMRTGKVIGLEALARWLHPELGLLSPDNFIQVAEETGQINALGGLILEQVLRDVGRWQEEGIAIPVALNVSARQFADHEFCQQLVSTIENSGCAFSLVEIEITEQVFLGDVTMASERLGFLREAGLSIALDDFGTGYASFNYLKLLPIDTLKIDRSFVAHIDSDPAESGIMKAMVSLCRDLHLNMVVEGVETAAQRDALVSLGCTRGQGFFFFPPMSCDEVEQQLHRQQSLAS